MKRHLSRSIIGLLAAVAFAAGCKNAADESREPDAEAAGVEKTSAAAPGEASPGKPSAPVDIDYDIVGVPIVGHPVNIDLAVSSTQGDAPVKLTWHVLDTGSLSFPESQLREVSLRVNARQAQTRQVTVVPQREGRLYLNVTAEVETADGAMLKSMAIPIQVGSAPGQQQQEQNGEVKQDSDGETIVSLPADEGS
ncbi:MAG TPA: hypothetical protein VHG33_05340 [Woeseiaceae bacterium]|nr:hypothetical protein [Woeseiaceae bacterium]